MFSKTLARFVVCGKGLVLYERILFYSRIMFWTDHGIKKVLKAYLDGSGHTELNVASDLTYPYGIAIDSKG